MSKTLAERFKQSIIAGDSQLPVQAHAALSAGDAVLVVVATGVTEADGAGTSTKVNAVVMEDIASGSEGRVMLAASTTEAQAIGSLL